MTRFLSVILFVVLANSFFADSADIDIDSFEYEVPVSSRDSMQISNEECEEVEESEQDAPNVEDLRLKDQQLRKAVYSLVDTYMNIPDKNDCKVVADPIFYNLDGRLKSYEDIFDDHMYRLARVSKFRKGSCSLPHKKAMALIDEIESVKQMLKICVANTKENTGIYRPIDPDNRDPLGNRGRLPASVPLRGAIESLKETAQTLDAFNGILEIFKKKMKTFSKNLKTHNRVKLTDMRKGKEVYDITKVVVVFLKLVNVSYREKYIERLMDYANTIIDYCSVGDYGYFKIFGEMSRERNKMCAKTLSKKFRESVELFKQTMKAEYIDGQFLLQILTEAITSVMKNHQEEKAEMYE